MFKNVLKGLYMILFIIVMPFVVGSLFSLISKDAAFISGLFTFLYFLLTSIQYIKYGNLNPLNLFKE